MKKENGGTTGVTFLTKMAFDDFQLSEAAIDVRFATQVAQLEECVNIAISEHYFH